MAGVILPGLCLVVPALTLMATGQESAPAKMTDAQAEALAKQALTLQDPAKQRAALERLRTHRFRSIKIPEREFVLYVQGLLEDRLGETTRAAISFRKLEVAFPQSSYLPEIQTVMAFQAIQRRKYDDAESRLRKALESDIPVEAKRRAQELLLWTLAETDRHGDGLAIVKSLQPLGTAKPSELGLVAVAEILCVAGDKAQAETARKDFQTLYPSSNYRSRVELAWARLLGTSGDAVGSAQVLRDIITADPDSPVTDEAKLALASLLSEGRLKPKEAEAFPAPKKLLDEIRRNDRKGNRTRQAMLVELRLHMTEARWKEAVETTTKLLAASLTPEEKTQTLTFRTEALRAWTQQSLDKKTLDPLLPSLDPPMVAALTPDLRLSLVKALARSGLPGTAQKVSEWAPPPEGSALRAAALEASSPESDPEETLKLLPTRGETPAQALLKARALLALKRWKEAAVALGKAKPGPDRVAAVVTYLRRPEVKGEGARPSEASAWLARMPEKGPDRAPLAILVADHMAKDGDWREALARYPLDAPKGSRGWVALMRATCQWKLGQKDAAKATLKAALDEPDFKMERQTLGRQLGL